MLSCIINILNPKSKNEKIELSVPTHTENDFTYPINEDAFTNTTADYLPFGNFQIAFGNSIYDIQIIEENH